jgi:hypothetical protein
MGKAIRASALVLLLACSAHAGWIQNDSPTPPPANAVQEPATDDNIQDNAEPTLTDAALNFLDNVLALF